MEYSLNHPLRLRVSGLDNTDICQKIDVKNYDFYPVDVFRYSGYYSKEILTYVKKYGIISVSVR